MFHTLTSVQDGAAVPLYNNLLTIRMATCGLAFVQSCTYTVGWFNVGPQEAFSWRPSGKTEIMGTIPFPPGLYSFSRLINLFSDIGINFTLRLNQVNCSAKMRVPILGGRSTLQTAFWHN